MQIFIFKYLNLKITLVWKKKKKKGETALKILPKRFLSWMKDWLVCYKNQHRKGTQCSDIQEKQQETIQISDGEVTEPRALSKSVRKNTVIKFSWVVWVNSEVGRLS